MGSYTIKNFGEDYYRLVPLNAHNGYLLILIERGIIGLLIYLFVFVYLSIKSFKLLRQGLINTPIVYVFLTLAFFAIGNNGQLTDQVAFLFLGGMFANIKEALVFENVVDKNLDDPLLIAGKS